MRDVRTSYETVDINSEMIQAGAGVSVSSSISSIPKST